MQRVPTWREIKSMKLFFNKHQLKKAEFNDKNQRNTRKILSVWRRHFLRLSVGNFCCMHWHCLSTLEKVMRLSTNLCDIRGRNFQFIQLHMKFVIHPLRRELSLIKLRSLRNTSVIVNEEFFAALNLNELWRNSRDFLIKFVLKKFPNYFTLTTKLHFHNLSIKLAPNVTNCCRDQMQIKVTLIEWEVP